MCIARRGILQHNDGCGKMEEALIILSFIIILKKFVGAWIWVELVQFGEEDCFLLLSYRNSNFILFGLGEILITLIKLLVYKWIEEGS